MKKHLFLVRHAKSSWAEPARSDFDRPLNKRGKRDAPFMGKRLATYGVTPEEIISSPANRASKTARAIAAELGYPKEHIVFENRLYTFEPEGLLTVLGAIDEAIISCVLVGHNQGITECAEWLTGANIGTIPTCGIVAIACGDKPWRTIGANDGSLLFFDYPKRYAGRSDE